MFLIIDIYRLGVVYPYLSTSISLDECDYYRYISHIIINVINNDEEIYIAIYLPKKFPDVIKKHNEEGIVFDQIQQFISQQILRLNQTSDNLIKWLLKNQVKSQ